MENETITNVEENRAEAVPAPEKSKKKKIMLLSSLAVLLLALLCGYIYVACFYRTHFFPNTKIDGYSVDKKTISEAAQTIENDRRDFAIHILGRMNGNPEEIGIIGSLDADAIGFQYVGTEEKVNALLENQNRFAWLPAYFETREYTVEKEYVYDEASLQSSLFALKAFEDSENFQPIDAQIAGYDSELKQYTITEEFEGAQIKPEKALKYVKSEFAKGNTMISLEEGNCYEKSQIHSSDRRLTKVTDPVNLWLSANITYDWHGVEIVVDADVIEQWIIVEGTTATLDEEAVAAFITEISDTYDLYGKDRTFHTMLGVDITVTSTKYGWKTDYEAEIPLLLEAIYAGETVSKEPAYLIEGYVRGANDIGDSYVEADLTNQHLYLVVNGNLQMETDLVSGTLASTKDCVTPSGVFGITYKKSPAILRGADYASKVTYWMPFYKNYGLHDATWRKSFGGTIYKRSGSHGCINLPKSAAAEIYEVVEAGFPVITYYYKDGELPEESGHEE